MVELTRPQRRKDFDYVMSMLEIVPEDDSQKLLMIQTKWGVRDINAILNVENKDFKDLASIDFYENALTLDACEVSETLSIDRRAKMKNAKIGEDFCFKAIDRKDFENFKFSNSWTKCQCELENINSTLPPNLTNNYNSTSKIGACTPAECFKKEKKKILPSTTFSIMGKLGWLENSSKIHHNGSRCAWGTGCELHSLIWWRQRTFCNEAKVLVFSFWKNVKSLKISRKLKTNS